MHSFLFPEDINGSSTRPRLQQSLANTHKQIQQTSRAPPRMPTRAPPTIPQQNFSAPPPPPTYAPPPIPMMKVKPAISITELTISDRKQEPGLQRSKSKWSRRKFINVSIVKERREAKARVAATMFEIDANLPPFSPVVDEEFWRTGRYPTSPLGSEMVHLAF